MKKLLYILLLVLPFVASAQIKDVIRTAPVPAAGANFNNQAVSDANLKIYQSFRLPRHAANGLYGAKDSSAYIYYNTTINRVVVYRGSGVYDTLQTGGSSSATFKLKADSINNSGYFTNWKANNLGAIYLNLTGSNAISNINIGNYGFSNAFSKVKDSVIIGGVDNGLLRINGAGSNDYGVNFGSNVTGTSITSHTGSDSLNFKTGNVRVMYLSVNHNLVTDSTLYVHGVGTQGAYEGQKAFLVVNGALAAYASGNVMGGPGGNGPTPGRVLTIDGLNDASVNDGYSIGIDTHPHIRATANGQNLSALWVDPDGGGGSSGFDLNGHTGVGTAGITNVQSLVEWSYIIHEGDFIGGQNAGLTAGYGGCTNCGPSLGYNEHILGVGDTYGRSGQTWDVGGYGGSGTHFDGLVVHPTFMNIAPSGGYTMGRQQGIDLLVTSKSVSANTIDSVTSIRIRNSIKDGNTSVNKQYGILIDALTTGSNNYGIDNKAPTLLEYAATASVGSAQITTTDPSLRFKATGSVTADKNTFEIRNIGVSGFERLQFRTINDANNVFTDRLQLWQDGGLHVGSLVSDPGTSNLMVDGTITASIQAGTPTDSVLTSHNGLIQKVDNTIYLKTGFFGGLGTSISPVVIDTIHIQSKLLAGTNITITGNTISATGGSSLTAGRGIIIPSSVIKQDTTAVMRYINGFRVDKRFGINRYGLYNADILADSTTSTPFVIRNTDQSIAFAVSHNESGGYTMLKGFNGDEYIRFVSGIVQLNTDFESDHAASFSPFNNSHTAAEFDGKTGQTADIIQVYDEKFGNLLMGTSGSGVGYFNRGATINTYGLSFNSTGSPTGPIIWNNTGSGFFTSLIAANPTTNASVTIANNSGTMALVSDIATSSHTIFTPTTGGTVTLVSGKYNIINPAGTLATLTVALPSSPANNNIVYIKYTQAVTSVTYSGGTVVGSTGAAVVGGLVVLTYDGVTGNWF